MKSNLTPKQKLDLAIKKAKEAGTLIPSNIEFKRIIQDSAFGPGKLTPDEIKRAIENLPKD